MKIIIFDREHARVNIVKNSVTVQTRTYKITKQSFLRLYKDKSTMPFYLYSEPFSKPYSWGTYRGYLNSPNSNKYKTLID